MFGHVGTLQDSCTFVDEALTYPETKANGFSESLVKSMKSPNLRELVHIVKRSKPFARRETSAFNYAAQASDT